MKSMSRNSAPDRGPFCHIPNPSYAAKKRIRLQAAMEFLMTYGWAILIVAIVLGTIFQLGIFSAGSLTGSSCVPIPGYLCQNPTLVTTGLLTFTFGETLGFQLNNLQVACTATSNSIGFPNPITAFYSTTTSGTLLPPSSTGNSIGSGQTLIISSLPCYTSTGVQLGSSPIGTTFTGYIWVNYTLGPTAEGPTNLWQTVKAMTIKTKVI